LDPEAWQLTSSTKRRMGSIPSSLVGSWQVRSDLPVVLNLPGGLGWIAFSVILLAVTTGFLPLVNERNLRRGLIGLNPDGEHRVLDPRIFKTQFIRCQADKTDTCSLPSASGRTFGQSEQEDPSVVQECSRAPLKVYDHAHGHDIGVTRRRCLRDL